MAETLEQRNVTRPGAIDRGHQWLLSRGVQRGDKRSSKAPRVVEAANLALLPAARRALHAKSVRVVPDVVANRASTATVGHQIASGNPLSPPALWADIASSIRRCTDAVERVSKELDLDSKSAFRRVIGTEAQRHPQNAIARTPLTGVSP